MSEQKKFLGVGRKFFVVAGWTLMLLILPKLGVEIEKQYIDASMKAVLALIGVEGLADIVSRVKS